MVKRVVRRIRKRAHKICEMSEDDEFAIYEDILATLHKMRRMIREW